MLFNYKHTAKFITELWKRVRKYGGYAIGISQNIQEILKSEDAKIMLGNSELIIMLNQSPIDRKKLSDLLNISETEMKYITNSNCGEGLIKVRNSIIPFVNKFPKNTELYKLMTTKLEEITKE